MICWPSRISRSGSARRRRPTRDVVADEHGRWIVAGLVTLAMAEAIVIGVLFASEGGRAAESATSCCWNPTFPARR
jgi:hypothetical protein